MKGTPAPFIEEPETAKLLETAAKGNSSAAGKLLEQHRDRMARRVRLRLDPRVRGCIGVSDVPQEAYVEAFERIGEYYKRRQVPFFVWLRFIVAQRILMVHRRHVRAKGRAVARELSLKAAAGPEASSVSIAQELICSGTRALRKMRGILGEEMLSGITGRSQ